MKEKVAGMKDQEAEMDEEKEASPEIEEQMDPGRGPAAEDEAGTLFPSEKGAGETGGMILLDQVCLQ